MSAQAKLIYVEPALVTLPCEGRLRRSQDHNPYYRARREARYGVTGGQCGRVAKVMVDGKNYCMTHGGRAALEYLLEKGDD